MTVVSSLSSMHSDVASLGSKTYDSPRKRREFPRRPKRQPTPSAASHGSSSKPPRSPEAVPGKRANLTPQSTKLIKSRSRSSSKEASSMQKTTLNRGPPTSLKSVPKPPRSETSTSSKNAPKRIRNQTLTHGENSSYSEISSVRTRSFSKASTTSRTSSSSKDPKAAASNGRTNFHVRVSLGYMTGIKVEQLTKKKKCNQDNLLLVGYASLAKSGKQIALSQPIIPKLGVNKQKGAKITWASPRDKAKDDRRTRMKRKLHFSVKLGREGGHEADADDSSFDSTGSLSPEVVKLEIGLKYGNDKYPLGIGNLVISGKETHEQKIDLAIRPISAVSASTQRSKLGIFGSNKKQQYPHCVHNGHTYKLSSNATLRVRIDVKAGTSSSQSKTAAWGEGDDASFATNWSFGTMGTAMSLTKSPPSPGLHQPRVAPEVIGSQKSRQSIQSQKSKIEPTASQSIVGRESTGGNNSKARSISSVELARRRSGIRTESSRVSTNQRPSNRLPVKYIVVRESADMQSLASGLTNPETNFLGSLLFQACSPLGFCGDDFELNEEAGRYSRRQVRDGVVPYQTGLNDDTLPSWNDHKNSDSSGTPETAQSDSEEDSSSSQEHQGTRTRREESINVDTKGKTKTNVVLGKESVSSGPTEGRPHLQKPQAFPDENPAVLGAKDEDAVSLGGTVDISVDTYTDLKDAQATLLRYASKVGVQMEDLLERADRKDAT